mgnify:CR=1 FL=1
MDFLNKKLNKENLIYLNNISDSETTKVVNFYEFSPFPNYKSDDDKISILEKGKRNFLTSKFKDFIGLKKTVLEVGCGTGQLSNFFALETNNKVVGLDPTLESLKIAQSFAKKNNINNIEFINADIFDDVLKNNVFDFIWCNGVLHHTKDPYKGFEILIKSLKVEGYVLIGLYNKYGRLRTILRKYFYKIFGLIILKIFDPTLRNLKNDQDEKKAWIRDQYHHPIESLHTMDEVLVWFKKNNIEYINSIPQCDFIEVNSNLFIKNSEGTFFTRFFNQVSMIFNRLGSDGGLFIMIGKKNGNTQI